MLRIARNGSVPCATGRDGEGHLACVCWRTNGCGWSVPETSTDAEEARYRWALSMALNARTESRRVEEVGWDAALQLCQRIPETRQLTGMPVPEATRLEGQVMSCL